MADSKITDLSAITGTNVATGDDLVIVDVSDTSMAASGTDKKITADELAAAMGNLGTVKRDSLYTTKGDIAIASTATTVQRLGVGSNNFVLAVDTSVASINVAYKDAYALPQAIDTVTATNYTLVLGDAGHFKQLNTVTVGLFRLPTNASVGFPIGVHVDFGQVNTGQYTVTTAAGVTLIANPATPKTTTSAMASVIKVDTDTWMAGGYLV